MKAKVANGVLLWVLALCRVTLTFASLNNCDNVVSKWLKDLKAHENPENATLTVRWNGLADDLVAAQCTTDLTLELWRVLDPSHARRPTGFGSQKYFSEYERCNKLEPEHFLYHSKHRFHANQSEVTFVHAVEQEYMFRVCPCIHRRHQQTCDCHAASVSHGQVKSHNQPQCSRVMDMTMTQESKVKSWCRPNPRPRMVSSGNAAVANAITRPVEVTGEEDMVEEISLKSLLMNCTHLLVAGRMASCTPIQPYDRVILTFHKLENRTSRTCWQVRDFGTYNPVRVVSRLFSQNPMLENFSDGVGDFTAIVGLSPDSSYCVQLEHLDHPYCAREITLGHSLHSKLPSMCSIHMAKPISTAACAALPSDVVTNYSVAHDTVFIATVFSLTLLVMAIVVCTGYKCYFSGNQAKNKTNRLQSAEHEPMISKILTSTSATVRPDMGKGLEVRVGAGPKVFLLHFPMEDNIEVNERTETKDEADQADQRYGWLRETVQSMTEVVDIGDEAEDEAINLDPEGWVWSHLSQEETQVVLVACKSMIKLLRRNTASSASSSSSSTASSASTTSSQISSKSTVAEASDMLTYTSSCSSQRSFTDSMEAEAMENTDKTNHYEVAEEEVNLDPRRELRAYALKYIQSHLAGNYKRLAIVSFSTSNADGGDSVAQMLTPNKGPLVLPHHLSDLQDWLTNSSHHARPLLQQPLVSSAGGLQERLAQWQTSSSGNSYLVPDHE